MGFLGSGASAVLWCASRRRTSRWRKSRTKNTVAISSDQPQVTLEYSRMRPKASQRWEAKVSNDRQP